MKRIKVIEQGVGYRIYLKDGIYFLEIGGRREKTDGYDSFESACESAYYQGLRKTK